MRSLQARLLECAPHDPDNGQEAETHLVDLMHAAARGEEVFIAAASTQGAQVVQLVAVTPPRRTPQFGSARGAISMAEDFDTPLADFAEYQ